MIVLEPGVDGEALKEYGPDLANKLVRQERWGRLQRALEAFIRAPRYPVIERGQIWHERRLPPRPPCEDSADVTEMFRAERLGRRTVKIHATDRHYVYFWLFDPRLLRGRGVRGEALRMKRNEFRERFRRVEG